MKRMVARTVCLLSLLLAFGAASALIASDDIPMKAMHDEMARATSMQLPGLAKPYFVAYRIEDMSTTTMTASLGSLVSSQSNRSRLLRVELRVGDYKLDNGNFLSFNTRQVGGFSATQQITIDDKYKEIRRQIWLATDSEYKKAVELFSAKQAVLQNQSHGVDLPDFTQERPNKYFESNKPVAVDTAALEALARQISAAFRQLPEPQSSHVVISVSSVYTRYLNSEGTEYTQVDPGTSVHIKATIQADDGMPIDDAEEIYVGSPSNLFATELLARAQQMVARLGKLRSSGTLDRYNGPVLFEGKAGGEIFAQMFAPALVASRDPVTDNPRGQAFLEQMTARMGAASLTDRIGGRVLPDFLTVVDNPRIDKFQGQRLTGLYSVDDDGLSVRINTVVDSGILKLVLNSRIPVSGIMQSTASRHGVGPAPTNVIVSSSKSVSEQELRRMLLERAKARGLDYGVIVRRAGGSASEFIQASMAMMQGGGPTGNNMLEVYKVYADGREELVHGVQLQAMTAASFKDIVAVGDKPVVYDAAFIPGFTTLAMLGITGDTGALNSVPVASYIVPSLLFEEASLKKASGPFPKPPVTAPPALSATGN